MAPWEIPAVVTVVALDHGAFDTDTWVYAAVLTVLLVAQGAYNYVKWKSEERSKRDG